MFFLLLLALCLTFETAAPKTFKVVQKDWEYMSSRKFQDKCHCLNGRLARIENAEKQRKVEIHIRRLNGLHSVLVDGARGSGSKWTMFYYADGTRINYTNWITDRKSSWDKRCIEIIAKGENFGKWNDARCWWPQAALCETPTFEFVYMDDSDTPSRHFQDKCRRLNGRLARIENAEEQRAAEAFIAERYISNPVLVDGARGSEFINWRRFFYEDGTPISYANWKSGEPRSWKDKCIEIIAKGENFGKWNDVRCWRPRVALCEI